MAKGVITDILSQQAFDQLEKLNKELLDAVTNFEKASSSAKQLDQVIAAAKGMNDYNLQVKKLQEVTESLATSQQRLETAYTDINTRSKQMTAAAREQTAVLQQQSEAYKGLLASQDARAKQIADYKLQLQQLNARQKELQKQLDANTISQNKYIQSTAKVIVEQNNLKTALSQAQIEFRNQAKEQQSAESSMAQMAQTLAKLKTAYMQLSQQERQGSAGSALLGDIQALDTQIKQLDATIGNHQRSVGNYNLATQGMGDQLQAITTKMEEMKAAGQENTEQFKQLAVSQEQLSTVMGSTDGKIASATVELNQIKNAMIQLELAGQKDSETFQLMSARAIELKAAMVNVGGEINAQTTKQLTAFEKLGRMFTRIVERLTIYFGLYQAVFGTVKYIQIANKAFEEMEDSTSRLNNILDNLGRNDALDRISTKAEMLAAKFKYLDKSDIQDVFTQLITYGKLTENQIDELMPLILNFAAKAGVSIKQAASDIIRSFEGNSRALKEYGINLKGTSKESERFAIVTKALEARVEGAGAAFEKTAQGQLADYAQQLRTAEEQTGKSTIQIAIWWEKLKGSISKSLVDTVRAIKDVFGGMNTKIGIESSDLSKSLTADFSGKSNAEIGAALKQRTDFLKQQIELVKHLRAEHSSYLKSALVTLAVQTQAVRTLTNLYNATKSNPAGNKILGAGGGDNGATKSHLHDTTNLELSIQRRINKAVAELQEEQIKAFADQHKVIADDEKKSLQDRLDAQTAYYADVTKISEIKKGVDLQDIQDELNKIEELRKVSVKKLSNQQKDLILQEPALQAERLAIIAKYNTQEQEQAIENAQRLIEIRRQAIQQMLNDEESALSNTRGTVNLNALNSLLSGQGNLLGKLKSGDLSPDKYHKKSEELNRGFEKKGILNDIAYYTQELTLYEDNAAKKLEIEQKLTQSKLHLQELEAKDAEDKAAKKETLDKQKSEAYIALAKQTEETVGAFIEAQFTNEKNHIQKQIDLNTRNKDAEIERIKSTTESEQQKANQIAIINASSVATEDQLKKRMRDEDIKQAKFEKEKALFDIAVNTSIAIAKAIAAFPETGGMPFTVIDAALGAAQAAAVLAKPIPKYAEGTLSAKAGLALTDEKGPELYIEPSGLVYFGADRPTLRNLIPGTQIISHDKVEKMMITSVMADSAFRPSDRVTETDKRLEEIKDIMMWQTGQLKKSYSNGKAPKVIIQQREGWHSYIRKNIYE